MAAGTLVSPTQLAGELGRPDVPTVLDCRWRLVGGADRAGYDRGHLPGAVFVDLDRELSAPPGEGGRHPLPDREAFQAAMRRAGVGNDRPVVAYDQGEPGGAARAWWLLGWFGHRDVRVLDGGLAEWVAAGLPLTADQPTPDPGDFTARPGHRWLLDAAGAARLAATGVLLDVRAPARYQGLEEPVDPVAGHIPGARNLPLAELLTDHGLAPAETIRQAVAARAAVPGTPLADGTGHGGPHHATPPQGPGHDPVVGAYCGSGVVAAQMVLALEVAGIPAALYAGSWSDWIRDRNRPVATGERP